jgi:hypothetical protein
MCCFAAALWDIARRTLAALLAAAEVATLLSGIAHWSTALVQVDGQNYSTSFMPHAMWCDLGWYWGLMARERPLSPSKPRFSPSSARANRGAGRNP